MDNFRKCLQTTNIECIGVYNIHSIDITQITKFLSNNKNIKYLQFKRMQLSDFTSPTDYSVFKEFLKLKGISLQMIQPEIIDAILSVISEQLEILRLIDIDVHTRLTANNHRFPNLREI